MSDERYPTRSNQSEGELVDPLDDADRHLNAEERDELDEAESSPAEVNFSTQDFDVFGLVRRMERESIIVPVFGGTNETIELSNFQRNFVWKRPQMDRFIESLLLGYPIPGIFLVKQENNKYLVLDGQQRLRTLQYFYKGMYAGKEFSLKNVGDQFINLTYESLPEHLSLKLDDSYMQATIIDATGVDGGDDAIYQIFERMNSGGTQLTPHEIRVALYAGPGIEYIQSLNMNQEWRHLYGPISPRIRDQELVLRILAMYLDRERYRRPLKTFLNDFVGSHRRRQDPALSEAGEVFRDAALAINEGIGRSALRRKGVTAINAAQTEAVFVGVMTAISRGRSFSAADLQTKISSLLEDSKFDRATVRATSDVDSVNERLSLAISFLGE